MSLKEDLASIVGSEFATDDPDRLDEYARDYSLVQPRRPRCVAFPANTDQVAQLVSYANEHRLAVTPRSSRVGFYGAGIPAQGGIVLDLSRMNKILEIDPRDRRVRVEPGVTWVQIAEELSEYGLMVCNPLLPHPLKSVLTSTMEREPMIIPKSEYGEVFRTCQMVLPNGRIFHTGSAIGKGQVGKTSPAHFIPSNRLFMGAQGTFGIVTWAILKTEFIPTVDRLLFIAVNEPAGFIQPVYQIERRNLGSECLILNRINLATILADNWANDFNTLLQALPPWTIILNLAAGERFPQEKIAYEEETVMAIAARLDVEAKSTVGGIAEPERRLLPLLRGPWTQSETYWKFRERGGRQDIFFYTTLNRVPEFTNAIEQVAARYDYRADEIGIYLQPVERSRAVFCEYGFSFDPENAAEVERVRRIFQEASETAVGMGGVFATPYGVWAEMVYKRTSAYTATMQTVKNTLDPNRIMNPGKLCF